MKLRLPLFILVIVGMAIIACLTSAHATVAPSTVYANLGPLSLPIPWQNTNLVYLYNVTEKVNEVGGEMVFA